MTMTLHTSHAIRQNLATIKNGEDLRKHHRRHARGYSSGKLRARVLRPPNEKEVAIIESRNKLRTSCRNAVVALKCDHRSHREGRMCRTR